MVNIIRRCAIIIYSVKKHLYCKYSTLNKKLVCFKKILLVMLSEIRCCCIWALCFLSDLHTACPRRSVQNGKKDVCPCVLLLTDWLIVITRWLPSYILRSQCPEMVCASYKKIKQAKALRSFARVSWCFLCPDSLNSFANKAIGIGPDV